jgi:hypothetical protein
MNRLYSVVILLLLAAVSCGPVPDAADTEATVDEALTASLPISSVTASADDGNVAANVLDGSYSTRWSAEGNGAWLKADLGSVQTIGSIRVAWYRGNLRASNYAVSTSTDGVTFSLAASGTSSGTSTRLETSTFPDTRARYVLLTVNGNSENDWASVTELRVGVAHGGTVTDAGAITPKPDAGTVTPTPDAGTVTPTPDAGTPTPKPDAGSGTPTPDAGTPTPTPDAGTVTPPGNASTYEALVLRDSPVALWAMAAPGTGREPDLSGNGNGGVYQGRPGVASLPNGGQAADFDGASQYLTIPSKAAYSIPTTGQLTWEVWIRPDVLQFPNASGTQYVNYMGKCNIYSPTCEWESRMYSLTTSEVRPNRFSAYVFNNTAELGSGAYWQPSSNQVVVGHWYHVVGEYQTGTQVSGCSGPGSINIWVNGIPWNRANQGGTGCLSQYGITPQANNSPVTIGTVALDNWFKGAIGEVAFYNHLLTQAQITAHYTAMTGLKPTGSCNGSDCSF